MSELFHPWPQGGFFFSLSSLSLHLPSFLSLYEWDSALKMYKGSTDHFYLFLIFFIIQSKLISHLLVWISLITLTELKCAVESYFLGFYFMEMWLFVLLVRLNLIVMLNSVLRHFPNSLEGKFNIERKAVIICSESRFVSVLCTLLEEISLPRW